MSSTVTITPTVTEEIPRARISSRASAEVDQVYGRQTEVVVFDGCPVGLGVKIIGGAGEDGERDFGVFVKRIFFGGLVAIDGRLEEGDEVLEVNGDSLSGITNKQAVQLLRQAAAADYIKLIITRDEKARLEFEDCLDDQSESCGTNSVADQVSVCSQSSSRSPQGDRTWSPRDQLSLHDSGSPVPRVSPVHGSPRSTPVNVTPPTSNTYQLPDAKYRTPGELTSDDSDTETEAAPTWEGVHNACTSPTPAPTPLPAYTHPAPKVSNSTVAALGLPRGPLLPLVAAGSQRGGPAVTGSGTGGPAAGYSVGFLAASKTSTPHTGNLRLTSQSGADSVFEPSPVTATDSVSHDVSGVDPLLLTSPGIASLAEDGMTYDDHEADMNLHPTVSLDPRAKIRVEKLEVALRYLGIDPTPKQQQELRNMVHVDPASYVTYGDFVQAARQMFRHQLEQHNLAPGHPLRTSRIQVSPPSKPRHLAAGHELAGVDLGVLLEEREQLRRDLDRCQIALREKEKSCSMAEEELLRVRKEAQGAVQETRSLRSKVHLAEQAQRAAQSMEQDYEEVVRLLEVEMIELKARDAKVMDHPVVQKRLAVLTCQLRKSDLSKKTYEVATEKLLQFTEAVHEVLTGQGDGVGLRPDAGRGEAPRSGRPPHYLGKHKRHTTVSLAAEARDVVKTVKSLIEVEPLPFGWDEVYTEDGVRYYINHVTQVTSWNHPLSNVEHMSSRPGSSHGRPLPPMPPLQDYDIPESRA